MDDTELISQQTIERVRRDNCFDFLRYFFAFSLVLVHFCTLTETEQFWFISGQMRVKAFFTITGFLVVYSFIRRGSIKTYCCKRILRIVPAYATTILFCFLMGGCFSTLSAADYYCSWQSANYLIANLSFLNFIEPCLPGLFSDNPVETSVNGSLWSMKLEVLFYCFVPLMLAMMKKSNKLLILSSAFILLSIYNSFFDNSICTFIYFFSGTAVLLYFDKLCQHIRWILPVCVATYFVMLYGNMAWLNYAEPLLFSTIIVAIAYYCKPLNFLQRYDNISYGIYLYHYPVIQVMIQYDLHHQNIYLCLALTLLITISLALLSWYAIEKPILKRKSVFNIHF